MPELSQTSFCAVPLRDYELLDSGGGEKLERFGDLLLRRPDPQAFWRPALASARWQRADLVFERQSDRGGCWHAAAHAHPLASQPKPSWEVEALAARLRLRPTPFKHVGIFPEQAPNWTIFADLFAQLGSQTPRCLNLFAYTGVASILAAKAGFRVTHVDASKQTLEWTAENVGLSGLAPNALRILLEDALSFVRREVRRGALYELVLLDPPHYGRGPKGEKWQLESDLPQLIESLAKLLAPRAAVVLSTYAVGISSLSLANLLAELGPATIEHGELVLRESSARSLHLPAGFCARYWRELSPPAAHA